jgi:hypothetical protein
MNATISERRRARAERVRADHENGGRCAECRGGGRCGTLVLWWADILLLQVDRDLRERGDGESGTDDDGDQHSDERDDPRR